MRLERRLRRRRRCRNVLKSLVEWTRRENVPCADGFGVARAAVRFVVSESFSGRRREVRIFGECVSVAP